MAGVSSTTNVYASYSAYYQSTYEVKNEKTKQADKTKQAEKTAEARRPGEVYTSDYGKTIGEPKLSEAAQKYYEQLKKKFGNYDFILVSKDEKANAQANASKYGNSFKMVVLIDEEKIERMATDPAYRKKYEAIISGAKAKMDQLKSSLMNSGANVSSYGMSVDSTGTTSLFAELRKSSADQQKRIEASAARKKAEKKAADKKASEKKAAAKLAEKKAEKKASEKKAAEKAEEKAKADSKEDVKEETVTFKADSVEALMKQVEDFVYEDRNSVVRTAEEKMVGQHFDFRG